MTKQATGKRSPWGIVNGFTIPREDGTVYLTRWGVRTPFGGVYIHKMTGPDERQVPHDHPWAFVSLIVKGGYDELRINKHDTHAPLVLRRHRTWTLNRMRRDDAHFIRTLHDNPTWTIVLFGKRRRTWGFWFKDTTPGSEGWWTWSEFDKTEYEAQRLVRVGEGLVGLPTEANDGDLLVMHEGGNAHIKLGSNLPWSDPESDPLGDVLEYVRLGREQPTIRSMRGVPGRCECGLIVLGPLKNYSYGSINHTAGACTPV